YTSPMPSFPSPAPPGPSPLGPVQDQPTQSLPVPDRPVLVVGLTRAAWLDRDGRTEILGLGEARSRAHARAPILAHGPASARRLGIERLAGAFDILELYAFVRPARFVVPTPRGLAAAFGLPQPASLEASAAIPA